MSNEEFLNQIQHMYDSAQYLNLENNLLTLNYNGTNTITLTNVSLTNLNPNLFLLQPDEIFDTLHILDILPKQEINDYESTFINNYVNKYLELNDKALEHSKDIEANEDLEELNTKLNGLTTSTFETGYDLAETSSWTIAESELNWDLGTMYTNCGGVEVKSVGVNCRDGARSSNTTVLLYIDRCTDAQAVRTTKKYDSSWDWFYLPTQSCYSYEGGIWLPGESHSCGGSTTTGCTIKCWQCAVQGAVWKQSACYDPSGTGSCSIIGYGYC